MCPEANRVPKIHTRLLNYSNCNATRERIRYLFSRVTSSPELRSCTHPSVSTRGFNTDLRLLNVIFQEECYRRVSSGIDRKIHPRPPKYRDSDLTIVSLGTYKRPNNVPTTLKPVISFSRVRLSTRTFRAWIDERVVIVSSKPENLDTVVCITISRSVFGTLVCSICPTNRFKVTSCFLSRGIANCIGSPCKFVPSVYTSWDIFRKHRELGLGGWNRYASV